jgi:hypothetical protein
MPTESCSVSDQKAMSGGSGRVAQVRVTQCGSFDGVLEYSVFVRGPHERNDPDKLVLTYWPDPRDENLQPAKYGEPSVSWLSSNALRVNTHDTGAFVLKRLAALDGVRIEYTFVR